MSFLVLSLVPVFILQTDAHLCLEDVDLDNVQRHSYDLPYHPLDDYWNRQRIVDHKPAPWLEPLKYNFNLAFHVFGKFSGNTNDSVIKAGYYAEGDELIYSVEVNCADQTWKSYVPSNSKEMPTPADYVVRDRTDPPGFVRPGRVRRSQDRELYQEGKLYGRGRCVEGEEFDLVFKVKTPHQFTWMFNSENLHRGYKRQWIWRAISGKVDRMPRYRSAKVPSPDLSKKGGATTAVRFKVESSGAAVITRFAFGRCMAWPRNMPCNKTELWLRERSKIWNPLGLHNQIYTVKCFPDVPTLYQATQILHPNEFSKAHSTWVCCVNMKTGELWNEDKNNRTLTRLNNCREYVDWDSELKPFFCGAAFDFDLVKKEMAKYEAERNGI